MKRLVSLFLLLACFGVGLFAQSSSINGNVMDPSGAVIPGATISLLNLGTGAERHTVADTEGRYAELRCGQSAGRHTDVGDLGRLPVRQAISRSPQLLALRLSCGSI